MRDLNLQSAKKYLKHILIMYNKILEIFQWDYSIHNFMYHFWGIKKISSRYNTDAEISIDHKCLNKLDRVRGWCAKNCDIL